MAGTNFMALRRLLTATAAAAAIACAAPALAQHRQFSVPARPATEAVAALARQANVQILLPGRTARNIRTNPVSGAMPVEEALRIMFDGTGLIARRTGSQTWTIVSAGETPLSGEAQAGGAQVSGVPGGEAVRASSLRDEDHSADEAIVVTGTNIRGVSPTSPVLKYTARDLENTGYGTLAEVFDTIPQNFGGGAEGASQDGIFGQGQSAGTNHTASTSINLRGLGTTGTLVLLNGHRLAPGQFSRSPDISQIPLGAIERIEIVADGASAVYGSDAIGGVVNVILKRDYQGLETLVRHSFVTEGSRTETIIGQSGGVRWSGGGAMAGVQYSRQTPLSSSDRSFTAARPRPTDLLPGNESYSAIASISQEVGPDVRLFADATYSDRDGYRFLTSTGDLSRRTDYQAQSLNVSAAVEAEFAPGWQADLSGLYSRQRDSYVQRRVTATTTRVDLADVGYTLGSTDLIVRGRVGNGPRAIRLAAGGGLRVERYDVYQVGNAGVPTASITDTVRKRNIANAFGEVVVPLIVADDQFALARAISLNGAIRVDDYSDVGSTTNYRAGMSWEISDWLRLRGNYSTSFRAPAATEVNGTVGQPSILVVNQVAPGGTGVVPILRLSSSGLPLRPETARTWSAGIDLNPRFAPGLSFELNYYDIDYRDRILAVPYNSQMLVNRPIYEGIISDFSSDAEVQAYVGNLISAGAQFVDLLGRGLGGIRTVIDVRQRNIAVLEQSGFDVSVRYQFAFAGGTLSLRANASVINHIRTSITPTAPSTDLVDTVENPLRLRLRGDIGWSGEPGSINFAVNRAGDYINNLAPTAEDIEAWTTIDLVGRLNLGWLTGMRTLDGATFGVTVKNLLNADPPYIRQLSSIGLNYDVANASPEKRVVGFELRFRL
jgi:iron complex outermembrane recepter protein